MISKAQIKFINSLKFKKQRQKYNLFVTEGKKLAKEMLQSNIQIETIYATENWILNCGYDLQNMHTVTKVVSERELHQVSNLKTPNEVLIVAKMPDIEQNPAQINKRFSLVLNKIQDPGNLGTIIRIADWFSIPYIFCDMECVDVYNPKVIQASMGSFTRVEIFTCPLAALFEQYDAIPVYGSSLTGDNIYNIKSEKSGFILLGNESEGISKNLRPYIDHNITIPKYGSAESLNVAIACALICAEFRK